MDALVKPLMEARDLRLNPATVCCGMVKKRHPTSKAAKHSTARQLPSNSPGKTEKRTAKALKHADGLLGVRDQVARNAEWLVKNAAGGSVPKMADETGLAVNTIRRLLARKGGTTLDTLFLIANTFGLPPQALFDPLSGQDMRMVEMMEGMKKDIEELQAKSGP